MRLTAAATLFAASSRAVRETLRHYAAQSPGTGLSVAATQRSRSNRGVFMRSLAGQQTGGLLERTMTSNGGSWQFFGGVDAAALRIRSVARAAPWGARSIQRSVQLEGAFESAMSHGARQRPFACLDGSWTGAPQRGRGPLPEPATPIQQRERGLLSSAYKMALVRPRTPTWSRSFWRRIAGGHPRAPFRGHRRSAVRLPPDRAAGRRVAALGRRRHRSAAVERSRGVRPLTRDRMRVQPIGLHSAA